jgi:hypothetical protein
LLTVRAEATALFGASSLSREVAVVPEVDCSLASLHVKTGTADHGTCIAHEVPIGTDALVQYESAQRWYNAVQGNIRSPGTFTFLIRATGAGLSPLRVVIEASRLFTMAIAPLGTLVVTA